MHGVEDKTDMWLNWSPDQDYGGLDKRIAEWVLGNVEKAMGAYWDAEYDAGKIREAEREKAERDELARLKAKYDQE